MFRRMTLVTLFGLLLTPTAFAEIPSALAEQVTKITADDADANDQFGYSVALSGTLALVGAYRDEDGGIVSGSAYIFERDQGGTGNWGQVTKLTADDGAEDDEFGISVALSGTLALVGAHFDDDGGVDSGSAYVFERDQGGAGNWGQVAKLTAGDAAEDDRFGISVALDGTTALVGAYLDDDDGSNSGSAYVFERDQGGAENWGQVAKITADDAAQGDLFGMSVALHGTTALTGAFFDDDGGNESGSAYVFERDQGGAGNWGQVAKLTAEDPAQGDEFGFSVALSGTTALVGAYRDEDGGIASGSAYIFERDQGGVENWGQVTKIAAEDTAEGDLFGISVALRDITALVGTVWDDDGGFDSGSTYVFERDQGGPGNWGQVAKITADDAAQGDQFGFSVALSGTTALIGAYTDQDAGINSGSAYVFTVGPSSIFQDGFESGNLSNWSSSTP